MTCSGNKEPKGSASSSTEPSFCEKKGRHCLTHPYGWPNTDGKCCVCGITREELEPKTKGDFLRCRCDHYQINHRPFTEGGCRNCACQTFRLVPQVSDCPRTHPESGLRCTKDRAYFHMEHVNGDTVWDDRDEPEEGAADDAHDFVSPAHCAACMASWLPPDSVPESEPRCEGCGHTEGEGCGCPPRCTCGCPRGSHMGKPQGCIPHGFHEYSEEPEPPLTPEEEEEAPEDRCTCGETACESELCDCDSVPCPVDHAAEELAEGPPCSEVEGCDGNCCAKAPPPPQPDRRPPSLVAYSVQGHLYEVALPGDATVQAVDGALVITHALGPVAGIVQIMPVPSKEQG